MSTCEYVDPFDAKLELNGLNRVYDWLCQEHERQPINYIYVFADHIHHFFDRINFAQIVVTSDCTLDIISEFGEIYKALEPNSLKGELPVRIVVVFVYEGTNVNSRKNKKRCQCADQVPPEITCIWATDED
jgi:hypothetical protein